MSVACKCSFEIPSKLIVEADFADPIWCGHCRANLEIGDFKLTHSLQNAYSDWLRDFVEWFRMMDSEEKEYVLALISKHNEVGLELTDRLKEELGENYSITFLSAKYYSSMTE